MADISLPKTICVFRVAEIYGGIGLDSIDEIFYCPPTLRRVPTAASFLVGVTAFNRRPLPIIRPHLFLNQTESPHTPTTSVIVVHRHQAQVGLWSDTVPKLISITASQFQPPERPQPYVTHFCYALDQLIAILNLSAILETAQAQLEVD